MSIAIGLYKHFKGSTYRVIGVGRHSETLEEMVIYVSPKSDADYWVRPLAMFDEIVEHEGKSCKRFTFIE